MKYLYNHRSENGQTSKIRNQKRFVKLFHTSIFKVIVE